MTKYWVVEGCTLNYTFTVPPPPGQEPVGIPVSVTNTTFNSLNTYLTIDNKKVFTGNTPISLTGLSCSLGTCPSAAGVFNGNSNYSTSDNQKILLDDQTCSISVNFTQGTSVYSGTLVISITDPYQTYVTEG